MQPGLQATCRKVAHLEQSNSNVRSDCKIVTYGRSRAVQRRCLRTLALLAALYIHAAASKVALTSQSEALTTPVTHSISLPRTKVL